MKSHYFCVTQKLGFVVLKDGEVDLDHSKNFVLEKLESSDMSPELKENLLNKIESCFVKKATPEDTAYDIVLCINNAVWSKVHLYV